MPFCAWAALAAACASHPRLPGPAHIRTWPPAPERPRIGLLGEIRNARDLGFRRTGGRGFFRFLVGTEPVPFDKPYAIAVHGDAEGTGPGGKKARGPARIAISDIGTQVVHLFDLERGIHRVVAKFRDGGFLQSPVAVAFDAEGRLYVCDSGRALVLRFDRDGGFDAVLASGFSRPAGLAIDRKRRILYVADAAEHVVRRFDLDGQPRGALPVPLRYPAHLAVDREGRLAITDSLNFRVVVLSPAMKVRTAVGHAGDASGDLQRPKGVGLDSESHLYAVDALFDNVQIFDLHGRLLLAFGSAGAAAGEFALPAGLAIDDRDRVYVADTYNSRVQVFQYLGGEPK